MGRSDKLPPPVFFFNFIEMVKGFEVLAISGSGRKHKSNTDWMIFSMIALLKRKKVKTSLIKLCNYNIKSCRGCDYCRKSGKLCRIRDDMKRVYLEMGKAKGYIIGSPNYFKNVSGQMKNFMDRTNVFVSLDQNTGKVIKKLSDKFVVGICVGGEEISDTKHCEEALKRFFKAHNLRLLASVKAKADLPGEIKKDKNIKVELKKACDSILKHIFTKHEN